MVSKKASELEEGDIIIVYGEEAEVKKIEISGKGIKQGRIKCRIEAETIDGKKPVAVIRLAEDIIEVR